MATLYKPSGESESVQPDNGSDYSIEEIQGFVEGRFGVVPAIDGGLLLVNEDGLRLELEENLEASTAADQEIVGPALYIPVEERDTLK